jgi:hypothetical protein
MSKLNWDDLIAEIREEWRGLWHNASLLGLNWGDMTDHEADYCNSWINMRAPHWLDDLETLIHEQTGLLWSLEQYGRGAATVAPAFMREYDRHLVDGALEGEYSWSRDLEGYNRDYATLRGLRILDREVRAFCKRLPELWEAEKEDLGITFDEDD